MDEFAVGDAPDSDQVTRAEDPPLSATGPELAAENKCAYNQHIEEAPRELKPVARRTILIARAYDPANKRAEKVAEALIKRGDKTLEDLMYKTRSQLKAELDLAENYIDEFAEGLKKYYFYLRD